MKGVDINFFSKIKTELTERLKTILQLPQFPSLLVHNLQNWKATKILFNIPGVATRLLIAGEDVKNLCKIQSELTVYIYIFLYCPRTYFLQIKWIIANFFNFLLQSKLSQSNYYTACLQFPRKMKRWSLDFKLL